MREGKLSEPVMKRSVLRQLTSKYGENIKAGVKTGSNVAVVCAEGTDFAVAVSSYVLESEKAAYYAVNAAVGKRKFSLLLNLLRFWLLATALAITLWNFYRSLPKSLVLRRSSSVSSTEVAAPLTDTGPMHKAEQTMRAFKSTPQEMLLGKPMLQAKDH